ncbi:MAG: HAD-IC family P-type ATPase, partial [Candidatus Omnitrophica bacterium]|nr:HAD-IC family P-type ATPase [Candidatus Omnitrophota bacterium]
MKKEHACCGMGGHAMHHARMVADFKQRFWVSMALTLPIFILSPVSHLYIVFGLSSVVFFYGGFPFLKGLYDELKNKEPGMMTLIAIAITIAYVYSAAVVFGLTGKIFFWELATLVDIMLLGHWIEMRSVMGASMALEGLAQLMPSQAHKIMANGSVEDVPLDELNVFDKIIIKPGEKIPADADVIEGESTVNEAMLTGESNPVVKTRGARVIGGSINGEGSLTVGVKKTGKDSFLSQVIELVRQAQESKSKTQDLANRAALWLTIIALSAGAITLFVWLAMMQKDFTFALERTVTVMVITCPHALGLAVPLVVAVSTALAASHGLLIRNRAAFERARNIQAIIFDKTGTLTEGKFGVTDTINFTQDVSGNDILQYAASVESRSEHPIAKGIVASFKAILAVEGFQAIIGKGAEGR